jgi:hypothetical protein
MHCLEPACCPVCPVAALEKRQLRSCITKASASAAVLPPACPFGVPKYEWDNALMPRVAKWTSAPTAALTPAACVAACPTGTLKFGKRGELQEAKARLDPAAGTRGLRRQRRRYVVVYLQTGTEELGFPEPAECRAAAVDVEGDFESAVRCDRVGLMLSAVVRWRTRKYERTLIVFALFAHWSESARRSLRGAVRSAIPETPDEFGVRWLLIVLWGWVDTR